MNYIYVITPVGSDPEYKLKRELLEKISVDTGCEFFFPLERHSKFSMDTTIADLRRAALTIADLSLERPSCYFELGIAQALGVPVVMIAQAGTILHQTDNRQSPQFYSDSLEYYALVTHAIESVSCVICQTIS